MTPVPTNMRPLPVSVPIPAIVLLRVDIVSRGSTVEVPSSTLVSSLSSNDSRALDTLREVFRKRGGALPVAATRTRVYTVLYEAMNEETYCDRCLSHAFPYGMNLHVCYRDGRWRGTNTEKNSRHEKVELAKGQPWAGTTA